VATDVGACREMIIGSFRENPPLGPAGEITSLASPDATANAIFHLLEDPSWYERCATIMRRRIQLYYNKKILERAYSALYTHYLSLPDSSEGVGGFQRWQG